MTEAYCMVDPTSSANFDTMKTHLDTITGHGVHLCLNQEAQDIDSDSNPGVADLATFNNAQAYAEGRGVKFAVRWRGGNHFATYRKGGANFTWVPQTESVGAGKTLPLPFHRTTGVMNTTVLGGIEFLAKTARKLCGQHCIDIWHGTWPNGPSAEMYATPEMASTFPGVYNQAVVDALYAATLATWQSKIPQHTVLEMPHGGLEGSQFIHLQDMVQPLMAARSRQQRIQLNWLDDRDNLTDSLTKFDDIARPPNHGFQMISNAMFLWSQVEARARTAFPIEYIEYYYSQFTSGNSTPGYRTSDLYVIIDNLAA